MTDDQPNRSSDINYCSVIGNHYWANCKTASDRPAGLAAIWYRRCMSCGFVDLSEMAARAAVYERMAEQIDAVAAAVWSLIPIVQQVIGPFAAVLGQIADDAAKSKE